MTETVHLRAAPELPSEPPPTPLRRHLLGISDLDRDDIERLLGTAATIARSLDREVKKLPALRGRLVVNLFYESSTRTLSSFDLAAKRLSADTMAVRSSGSSVDKGESLLYMLTDPCRIRPGRDRDQAPAHRCPRLVADATDPAHVVNAGDGKHQHPTQALLDLYTMREALGRLDGLHVAIVGDVLHSRVARSLIEALALVGARTTLVGPPTLIPRGIEQMGCEASSDIETIDSADIVYVLRMQRERMLAGAAFVPSLREYAAEWGITSQRLRPGQIVMHPGPMNRGVEIDPQVADSDVSLITEQVARGSSSAWRCSTTCSPVGRSTWPAAWRSHDPRLGRHAPGDSLTIRGARVIDPTSDLDGAFDVTIEDGIIVAIDPAVESARGLVLAPAFVDPHVHLRVPGREDEETIASGTAAAAAGGYCAILAMPNTDPVVDSAAVLGALIEQAREDAVIPTGFMDRSRRGSKGEELTEMAELARLGAAAFTDDGHPVVSAGSMQRALQYSAVTGRLLALHEEEPTLSRDGQMHDGAVSA